MAGTHPSHALQRHGRVALIAIMLGTNMLAPFAQTGLGVHVPTALAASKPPSGKNTYSPLPNKGGSSSYPPSVVLHKQTTAPVVTPLSRQATSVSMTPADLALDPSRSAHLLSNDGRLEVTVPVGALPSDATTVAGGPVRLHVTEVAGPSGGTNSGEVTLGTYKFQLEGPNGAVDMALNQPITVVLHYAPWRGAGFELENTQLILNGDAPLSALAGSDGTVPAGLKPAYVPAQLDTTHETLTATITITSSADTPAAATPIATATATATPVASAAVTAAPSATAGAGQATGGLSGDVREAAGTGSGGGGVTGTWVTNSPEAQWTKPSDTSVDLSAGGLSYSYPLDLSPGPGGLTPQVQLSYSSGAVNEDHDPQAAAGWVGEGWDLSLGSITWTEDNISSNCNNTQASPCWENDWHLSDAYGTSADLIPPDTTVSSYYDDTPNPPPTNTYYVWHVTPESRIKVVSFAHANSNWPSQNYSVNPPCFRVWLTNGVMEEFGCTTDSLQFYVDESSGSGNYKSSFPYRWDLDMIVDPNGNQIHITYNQDLAFDPVNNVTFPMDAVPATITYDSPGCHSTSTMCTGSSWQPLVQIAFNTSALNSPNPAHLYPTGQPSCSQFTYQKYFAKAYSGKVVMRCDDPRDLSGSGGLGAPELLSILALNDVLVQVTTNGASPTWHTLRDYQLSYQLYPSTSTWLSHTILDGNTGKTESVAGAMLLTRIQELGDDSPATTLPPLTMQYQQEVETYLDSEYAPTPSNNCDAPQMPWNATQCKLFAQSFNNSYLSELDNGRGWSETYTWETARNNTHGVPQGSTLEDPTACNNQMTTLPCSLADDENWSRIVLASRQATVQCVAANGSGCGPQGSSSLTSTWSYKYTLTDLSAYECSGCTVGMYWGNMNDGDKLDFYNPQFMGFATASVTNPDGSVQSFQYQTTLGYGVWGSSVTCVAYYTCSVSPWTNPANALHGRVKEEDDYDIGGQTLLRKQTDTYSVACPPAGVSASPHAAYSGELSAELDQLGNPIVDCEITPNVDTVYQLDGGSLANAPTLTFTDSFSRDSAGHLTQSSVNQASSDGGATNSPTTIVQRTQYLWDDNVTLRVSPPPAGTYLVQVPGLQTTEDGSGNVKACTYSSYDGAAYTLGSTSALTKGLETRTDQYAATCGGSPTGPVSTTTVYNGNGDPLGADDADALAGVAGHTNSASCTIGGTAYSACAMFDSPYQTHVTQVENALNQATTMAYTGSGAAASNGWGQWETSQTDANGQTTSYTYDGLGRLLTTTLPAEGTGLTTTSDTYTDTCAATGAATPCVALGTTQRLDSGTTVTSATYYDGWGRAVETVTPAPNAGSTCQYSVSYTLYDPAGRVNFTSDPYLVAASSCPSAGQVPPFYPPDTTQPGTTTLYDGLGRTVKVTDALGHVTQTSYAEGQVSGANITDSGWYEQTTTVDGNSHQTADWTDAFGRTLYSASFTGNSGPYALYGVTRTTEDYLGDVTALYGPNNGAGGLSTSAQTTATYDLLGRETGQTDADRGTSSYSYDQDSNLTESVDARGAVGTVFAGYDGLDRQLWRNTSNSSSGAYVTYSYDSTASGNDGVGRLTGETFSGGPNSTLSGSYAYVYDGRGQTISLTLMVGGNTYPVQQSYDDAGLPLATVYPDGENVATSYTSQGWVSSLATTLSGTTTTLLNNVSYSGVGGAAGAPTAASEANGTYTYSASYDALLRPTDTKLTLTSNGSTLFEQAPSYDAVGNVTGLTTTLPQGSDNQAFCYDELDRLTWASSQSGSTPCGGSNTAGTLTSAQYTQSYSYDQLDRLTGGTTGSYSYGDSAHVHAATAIGPSGSPVWTASYDAAGNMVCRAPTNVATCTGGSTGAALSYDNEGRLASWQNAPTSPSTTATYLYDGEGNRVEQQVTNSGVTTSITYVGDLEELSTSGGITSTTTYYYAGGQRVAEAVNGTFSYLASDRLGSAEVALDGSGNVQASQLYGSYGNARYSSGTMPGTYGFTGQRADAATGLDYYNARYYDPNAGQFISADTILNGLDRYAYVGGNPETRIDPSGHIWPCDQLGMDPEECLQVAFFVWSFIAAASLHFRGYMPSTFQDWLQGAGQTVNDVSGGINSGNPGNGDRGGYVPPWEKDPNQEVTVETEQIPPTDGTASGSDGKPPEEGGDPPKGDGRTEEPQTDAGIQKRIRENTDDDPASDLTPAEARLEQINTEQVDVEVDVPVYAEGGQIPDGGSVDIGDDDIPIFAGDFGGGTEFK